MFSWSSRQAGLAVFQVRDFLFILVAYGGMAGGVFLPESGGLFTPFVLHALMGILFLSLLRIDYQALMHVTQEDLIEVGAWTLLKLAAMPLAIWIVAKNLVPSYALPVLLLSGVSTGVMAPFMSNLLGANTTRVLQVVVTSSIFLPLTLPACVELLMGEALRIPFFHMFRMLLLVVFVPMGAVLFGRRVAPRILERIERLQYPLSLILFFIIGFGVFAQHAAFLEQHVGEVALAGLLAFALAVLYACTGFVAAALGGRHLEGLTGAVSLTFVNNVLVVVFASRFFGPQAPLLAAMYALPFFGMIIPLRWFRQD